MAKGGESDLALKARSHDLQNRKRKQKKIMSFSAIVDLDKI